MGEVEEMRVHTNSLLDMLLKHSNNIERKVNATQHWANTILEQHYLHELQYRANKLIADQNLLYYRRIVLMNNIIQVA